MNYEQSARAQTERLMADGHATILAIESSCDETAAAIVRDGRQVISSVISSQIPLHAMSGGVVPELASRAPVESVDPVVDEALKKAGMTLSDVDAVAVTYGPGLVGALLIGVSAAKALAYAAGKPLVPVNHIEGHVSANYVAHPDLEPPFVCLVASGGHSHIVRVEDYGVYTLLGQTMDDAAGGVASNSGLRNTMNDKCQKAGLRLVMPPPILCTDNAAMIGSAAFYRLMRGEIAGLDLNACPSLRLV